MHPAERRSGRRMYGPEDLRRLAFVHLIHRLGMPLATAGVILDVPGQAWRDAANQQIAELEDLITRARGAQTFLTHAFACPVEHPISQCPQMIATLDELVAGKTFEQLAAEYSGH